MEEVYILMDNSCGNGILTLASSGFYTSFSEAAKAARNLKLISNSTADIVVKILYLRK